MDRRKNSEKKSEASMKKPRPKIAQYNADEDNHLIHEEAWQFLPGCAEESKQPNPSKNETNGITMEQGVASGN